MMPNKSIGSSQNNKYKLIQWLMRTDDIKEKIVNFLTLMYVLKKERQKYNFPAPPKPVLMMILNFYCTTNLANKDVILYQDIINMKKNLTQNHYLKYGHSEARMKFIVNAMSTLTDCYHMYYGNKDFIIEFLKNKKSLKIFEAINNELIASERNLGSYFSEKDPGVALLTHHLFVKCYNDCAQFLYDLANTFSFHNNASLEFFSNCFDKNYDLYEKSVMNLESDLDMCQLIIHVSAINSAFKKMSLNKKVTSQELEDLNVNINKIFLFLKSYKFQLNLNNLKSEVIKLIAQLIDGNSKLSDLAVNIIRIEFSESDIGLTILNQMKINKPNNDMISHVLLFKDAVNMCYQQLNSKKSSYMKKIFFINKYSEKSDDELISIRLTVIHKMINLLADQIQKVKNNPQNQLKYRNNVMALGNWINILLDPQEVTPNLIQLTNDRNCISGKKITNLYKKMNKLIKNEGVHFEKISKILWNKINEFQHQLSRKSTYSSKKSN